LHQRVSRLLVDETAAVVRKPWLRLLCLLADSLQPPPMLPASAVSTITAWSVVGGTPAVSATISALSLALLSRHLAGGSHAPPPTDLPVPIPAGWLECLDCASRAQAPLYLRGAAAEALLRCRVLSTCTDEASSHRHRCPDDSSAGSGSGSDSSVERQWDDESRLRGWALAARCLQDDDEDVRECMRAGVAGLLSPADGGSSLDVLGVLERCWAFMTHEFGHLRSYSQLLWHQLLSGASATSDTSSHGCASVTVASHHGHSDEAPGRLWDCNDEEGDNIHLEPVLCVQLAALQLRRLAGDQPTHPPPTGDRATVVGHGDWHDAMSSRASHFLQQHTAQLLAMLRGGTEGYCLRPDTLPRPLFLLGDDDNREFI
jgi:hypothetical protein